MLLSHITVTIWYLPWHQRSTAHISKVKSTLNITQLPNLFLHALFQYIALCNDSDWKSGCYLIFLTTNHNLSPINSAFFISLESTPFSLELLSMI